MKKAKLLFSAFNTLMILLLLANLSYSQNEGFGGTHSNFNLGVGARALALGNAYVAVPHDATAIYWNPAGLDYIQRKNASLFYTNLLAGTQYYFAGYVHPTISIGTFGVGIINIGIGDIEERDGNAVSGGIGTYSNYEILFAYSKQLPWNLAVGLNLKFDHQSYSGFMLSDVGTSATGIGTDVGVLFRPNLTNFMLDGLSVGLTVQNLIGSRLKMETATDINPLNVRFGLAKPFLKNEFGNQLTIFMDIEQGAKVPFKFHAGTEYVFQNMAMLRVGMNNSQLAFGAGAMFNMFQLDYSFGKFAPHDLSSSHRVSFSMHFGKSKDELIKIAAENRRQEMERMAEQQVQFERNQRIAESLERGKQYLKDGEYERALSEFNFIMQYERELPNAPVILEAKNLFEDADKKNKEKLTEEINKVVEHDAEKARRQREEIKLDNHFKQGMAYFEVDDYEKAIEQWNKMLEIDLGHKLAKQWIENARSKREQVILSAITMADRYAREGKLNDAIRELNKARMLNPDERQMKVIEQRVEQVENQMDFFDLYRQGYQYYIIKDYQNAMVSFQKALSYSPNDEKVKKFLYNAEVRAKARKETMTEDVKQKFMDGYKSFAAGKYEEALRIWEVLQKKQPYNKQILDGIDAALEKLENQNKGSKK